MSQNNAVKVQTVVPIVALIAACVMGGKVIAQVESIKETLRDSIAEQRTYNMSMERRMAEVERRLDRLGILSGFDKIDGKAAK